MEATAPTQDKHLHRQTRMQEDASKLHPNVVVSPSKAYRALFTKIRDVNTSSADFVAYSRRIMNILAEDAIAELPTEPRTVKTPCGTYTGVATSCHICVVSILRAGDALLESVRNCLPGVPVGKILIQREEGGERRMEAATDETVAAPRTRHYYSKMPPGIASEGDRPCHVLLCDPMLATGGSASEAIKRLVALGVREGNIVFANVISCPEGLRALASRYPQVKIVTAWVDDGLDTDKFIVPGLGDYGDRFFNT